MSAAASDTTATTPEQDIVLEEGLTDSTPEPLTETIAQNSNSSVDSGSEEAYQTLNDQYLRLAADFENFRKRTQQEQAAWRKYGAQMLIEELLPVLDNLERGQQTLSEASDPKLLYQSFSMLTRQLLDVLNTQGLTPLNVKGQAFNPQLHEAISEQVSDDHPENVVLEVVQAGYQLYDRVIRPARVVVSTSVDASKESSNSPSTSSNPFSQA